jgi:hypothetical protein
MLIKIDDFENWCCEYCSSLEANRYMIYSSSLEEDEIGDSNEWRVRADKDRTVIDIFACDYCITNMFTMSGLHMIMLNRIRELEYENAKLRGDI